MATNLPLIPRKDGAVCGCARGVLRDVFRALPAAAAAALPDLHDVAHKHPSCDYLNECERLGSLEESLWRGAARRVAREADRSRTRRPLHATRRPPHARTADLLHRDNLVPPLYNNHTKEPRVWARSVLAAGSDSCCLAVRGAAPPTQPTPRDRLPPADEYESLQSLSIGRLSRADAAWWSRPSPPAPLTEPSLPTPATVICDPKYLEFINFTPRQVYSRTIRVINTSRSEVRLSLRPFSCSSLSLSLESARGSALSSNAALRVRVTFTPRDAREICDALSLRATNGDQITIPVHCYIELPVLNVFVGSTTIVPRASGSVGDLGPGAAGRGGVRDAVLHLSARLLGDAVLDLGARLLGDAHDEPLLLQCDVPHALFYLLTEEEWIQSEIQEMASSLSPVCVSAGEFSVCPRAWRGRYVRGAARARLRAPGLATVTLRLLAAPSAARVVTLLADALLYSPKHVTIQAEEKTFDINWSDDAACEQYLYLGSAFPHRTLSRSITLINDSPVTYSYYWRIREWRDSYASDASAAATEEERIAEAEAARRLRVEPAAGTLPPRCRLAALLNAHDVGEHSARAVIELVLKDVPCASLPPGVELKILNSRTLVEEQEPEETFGSQESSERSEYGERLERSVCDVVCSAVEAWWSVVPLRFVLDPPALDLPHSKRVKNVEVRYRATQLFGTSSAECAWSYSCVPLAAPPPAPPAPPRLTSALSRDVPLYVPLHPANDIFTHTFTLSCGVEWRHSATVWSHSCVRHPALRPTRVRLDVTPPATPCRATLKLLNDTHQELEWSAQYFPWTGCAQCAWGSPCAACCVAGCCCDVLQPTAARLSHGQNDHLHFSVITSKREGLLSTLVRVGRADADGANDTKEAGTKGARDVEGRGSAESVSGVEAAAGRRGGAAARRGTEGRAALVVVRVMAPRVVVQVLPCRGDKRPGQFCEECALDGSGAWSVVRPRRALVLGHRSCCRLRLTNVTPVPTVLRWEPAIDDEEFLKIIFYPEEIAIGAHEQVEIRLVLEARGVCSRRVWTRRAALTHSPHPVYLLCDAAVTGIEVTFEVPTGIDLVCDVTGVRSVYDVITVRRSQHEGQVAGALQDPLLVFEEEDRKREVFKDPLCGCRTRMVFVPRVKPLRPPRADNDSQYSIDIVTSPPALTRVCVCATCGAPERAPRWKHAPALQFPRVPVHTVFERVIVLRNESVLAASWRADVRRFAPLHTRTLHAHGSTSESCGAAGAALSVEPARGTLAARAVARLHVRFTADCWGLYHDQIAIQVEGVEPLVVDAWAEAVGASPARPLSLAAPSQHCPVDDTYTLWMSCSESERTLVIKNESRAAIQLVPYVLQAHGGGASEALPFRLLYRFIDVPPPACPCREQTYCEEEGSVEERSSTARSEMDTALELYLAPNQGTQRTPNALKLDPDEPVCVEGHGTAAMRVTTPSEGDTCSASDDDSDTVILFRVLPLQISGPGWYRREPWPLRVLVRRAPRPPTLLLSHRAVHAHLTALALPYGDVMRVRKRIQVKNVGSGLLSCLVSTSAPWRVVLGGGGGGGCGAGCSCVDHTRTRHQDMPLDLMPNSSTELCVEVEIETTQVWPPQCDESEQDDHCTVPDYPHTKELLADLVFFTSQQILKSIPLSVELEFPQLEVTPAVIDFGFVADGDVRKDYFTVSHNSRSTCIDVVCVWSGSTDFMVHPSDARIEPGQQLRFYVQYRARWCGAGGWRRGAAEGRARVQGAGRAGGWLRCAAAARAVPAMDHKCRRPPHDYTIDTRLKPTDYE